MRRVTRALAVAGRGLEGDHVDGGRRQVTLLAREAWDAACLALGRTGLDPGARRANLVVEGLDLAGLPRGARLRLGPVEVVLDAETRPCQLLDDAAPGLWDALKPDGRGGRFGKITAGGELAVGDPIGLLPCGVPGYDRAVVRHDSQASFAAVAEVDPVALERPRRRFTGAEWDRLIELGFFRADERLELIDGEVRVRSPIGDPHAVAVAKVARALDRAYGAGHVIWPQNPLSVGDDRLYPDVVVLRGDPDDYGRRRPRPADAPLVIEVADSTLRFDLGEKAAVYAHGGVEEYWVVSLPDRAVVIHREPLKRRGRTPARFGDVTTITRGGLEPPGARRAVTLRSLLPTK